MKKRSRNKTRSILSLILSLALVLGMCTTSYAAEEIPDGDTGEEAVVETGTTAEDIAEETEEYLADEISGYDEYGVETLSADETEDIEEEEPEIQVFASTEGGQTLKVVQKAEGTIGDDVSFTYHLYKITEAAETIENMGDIISYEPGASLEYVIVETDTGEEVSTETTDGNGAFAIHVGETAEFTLEADTNWFVNQETPDAYPLVSVGSDSEYADVVGGTNGVVYYGQIEAGQPLTGSITVNVTDDSDPAEPLGGATFELYRVNDDGSTESDPVATLTTDENGQAVFTGLAVGVTYRIVQTSATDGYVIEEDPVDITLTQDDPDQTITVINLMAGNQVKYAVAIYGIKQDVDEDGNLLGLTFGPATGADYIHVHNSHLTEEEYESGEYGICLHWMTWDEIIEQSQEDPTAFQTCLENGCTHSVHVLLDESILGAEHIETKDTDSEMQGDGAGMLLDCINSSYRWWNGTASNDGGWPASLIRATLNGADNYTNKDKDGEDINVTGDITPLTEENCLLSCFPEELQENIVAKAVQSDTVYNSQTEENNQTTYDKLWLFSGTELYGYVSGGGNNGVIRTYEGELYQRSEYFGITTKDSSMLMDYGEYDDEYQGVWWWLRSLMTSNASCVYTVYTQDGDWWGEYTWLQSGVAQYGLAPGFCLQ